MKTRDKIALAIWIPGCQIEKWIDKWRSQRMPSGWSPVMKLFAHFGFVRGFEKEDLPLRLRLLDRLVTQPLDRLSEIVSPGWSER